MPINFGQPTESQTVAARNTSSRDAQVALAKWLEGEAITGPVAGIKRLNGGLVEEYNGSAWVEKALGYAKLASPTFTGTPAAPTAAVDTNTTQLATTAYVVGQGYLKATAAAAAYAALAGAAFTGQVSIAGRVELRTNGDISCHRGDNTGVVFLGNANTRYVYFDGSSYQMPGAPLVVNGGTVWTNATLTNLSQLTNGPGYITGAALSPYAVLNSAPTFSGLVRANGGGSGLGAITVSTAGPSGGTDGDLWLQY